MKLRVAIVGAGVTGLTAAWRLRAAGHEVVIYEKSSVAGGRTRSIRQDGFIFDVGAITMLPTYANVVALATELGIEHHLHKMTPVIGIPRDGEIHPLDLAHPIKSFLATRLISTATKLRLLRLAGPLRRAWTKARFDSLAPLADFDDETVGSFVRRTCGVEAADYIAGPVIRGNTLNSIDSAPYGEFLWMLRQYGAPHLFGFDRGINFLAETLADRLPVSFETEVTAVEPDGDGVIVRGRGNFVERFDACVIAQTPGGVLSLAPDLTAGQRDFLETIKPLKSISLHVGLRRAPRNKETFILPPVTEQSMLTTIVFDHHKAPGRARPGQGVLSFFMSDEWYEKNAARSDADLRDDILAMAVPFIGDLSRDVESFVVSRWDYAIIKSDVGLYKRIAAYEADIDPESRVQVAGDFLSMGMEAAVISGQQAAMRLIERAAADDNKISLPPGGSVFGPSCGVITPP